MKWILTLECDTPVEYATTMALYQGMIGPSISHIVAKPSQLKLTIVYNTFNVTNIGQLNELVVQNPLPPQGQA